MKIYKNFKIIRHPEKNKNYLVTIAIGKKYYNNWKSFALPLWQDYCKKNGLGIIVFNKDLVSKNYKVWKKPTWQKLLIGTVLKKNKIQVSNICYLDTDILINPYAPNVFKNYNSKTIGVVSLIKNISQPIQETLRRIAFLRKNYYSKKYPLDSALFMTTENKYKFHKLKPKNNFFCAGLFLFNVHNHTKFMKKIFDKYPSNIRTLTGGGDQTHLNYEFLKYGKISWLDYRFQAIWVYEMAWKYPFLYKFARVKKKLIQDCIESSLYQNYFLHFAGTWYESDMWKKGKFFINKNKIELKNYYKYLKTPIIGKSKGTINPKNI